MARPTKSINVTTGHFTKEQIEARKEAEEKLKGNNDKVLPFDYLSREQKKIFKYLVKEMESSGVIGNLDVYVLNSAAICIDRLNNLEDQANKDPQLIFNNEFLKARKEYTNSFNKACSELCLSPTSRAKIGSLTTQNNVKKDDPLLIALSKIKGGDR